MKPRFLQLTEDDFSEKSGWNELLASQKNIIIDQLHKVLPVGFQLDLHALRPDWKECKAEKDEIELRREIGSVESEGISQQQRQQLDYILKNPDYDRQKFDEFLSNIDIGPSIQLRDEDELQRKATSFAQHLGLSPNAFFESDDTESDDTDSDEYEDLDALPQLLTQDASSINELLYDSQHQSDLDITTNAGNPSANPGLNILPDVDQTSSEDLVMPSIEGPRPILQTKTSNVSSARRTLAKRALQLEKPSKIKPWRTGRSGVTKSSLSQSVTANDTKAAPEATESNEITVIQPPASGTPTKADRVPAEPPSTEPDLDEVVPAPPPQPRIILRLKVPKLRDLMTRLEPDATDTIKVSRDGQPSEHRHESTAGLDAISASVKSTTSVPQTPVRKADTRTSVSQDSHSDSPRRLRSGRTDERAQSEVSSAASVRTARHTSSQKPHGATTDEKERSEMSSAASVRTTRRTSSQKPNGGNNVDGSVGANVAKAKAPQRKNEKDSTPASGDKAGIEGRLRSNSSIAKPQVLQPLRSTRSTSLHGSSSTTTRRKSGDAKKA